MGTNDTRDKIELIVKSDEDSGKELDIRKLIKVLLKGKWIILGAVIVCIIVSFIALTFTNDYKGVVKTIVSFNFDGIEKGLDPKGNTFDISQVKSPVIIENVVVKQGLEKYGLNSDVIRNEIEIAPIIPKNITDKIKMLEEDKQNGIDKLQSFTYYPNRFVISFNVSKEYNISGNKAREILAEIIREYKNNFYETYSDRSILANAVGQIDYEEYDYPELTIVIRNQLDLIRNYLQSKIEEKNASDFRAKGTGMTFADIRETLDVVDTVDINRYDSIVDAFKLTKDKDRLIKYYEHIIKRKELEKAKKEDEAETVDNMLSKYQKSENTVLMPGLNSDSSMTGMLNLEGADDYYNSLSERYTNAGVESKFAMQDILYYQKEIEELRNDTVSQDEKAKAEVIVNAMIPNLKNKLENIINMTNDTVSEYYEGQVFEDAIKNLTPEQYQSQGVNKLYILIAGLAGFFLSCFVLLAANYMKNDFEEKAVADSVQKQVS